MLLYLAACEMLSGRLTWLEPRQLRLTAARRSAGVITPKARA